MNETVAAAAKGIWLGQALHPHNTAYWTAEAVELDGPLDQGGFVRAVEGALLEVEALHQCFYWTGDDVRRAPALERSCTLPVVDLSSEPEPEVAAQRFVERDLGTRVDLAKGPLFRTVLLRLGPLRHCWYLRVHHIAFDGYAYHLFRRRVADWFEAEQRAEPVGASSMVSLCELTAEESAYRASPAFGEDRRYFLHRFGGARTEAPFRLLASTCLRVDGSFSPGALRRIRESAVAAGVDWSAWLIAAVAALLREPSALGIPVTARLGSVAAATPCMTMNIVPLRAEIGEGERFCDFARRLGGELRSLRLHQRYRYEELKQALGLTGNQRPLFGTVVNLLPFESPARFGAARARVRSIARGPVEDLAITLLAAGERLDFDLEANPNSRTRDELLALAEALPRAIESFIDAPETVLSPASECGVRWPCVSGPAPTSDAVPVLELFRRSVASFPSRTAVEHDGRAFDYATLLVAVEHLAARLSREGVVAETRVAVLLPRCPEAIVAQLAVLWAGGAYVPLDPEGPRERIELVLEDVEPTLLICRPEHRELAGNRPFITVDGGSPDTRLPGPLRAPVEVPESALAYVIYTSGTTGRPNGVQIDRRALASFVAAASARYAITADDRVLQFAPLQFDASVEEILLSVTTGATLVLRSAAMLESLSIFLATCGRLGITVLDLPTAFFHELVLLLESGATLPGCVRLVIIGGEAAAPERVRSFRARARAGVVLLNTYGPTETTVVATVAELAGPAAVALDGPAVPIGLPLSRYSVLVLDEQRTPVRPGVEGELCVLGPALSRGYFGQPELTRRRFVELESLRGRPRGYLTGDRVRQRADGQLVYAGRIDDELKISGHRVNPLEIEAALLDLAGVIEAAVVVTDAKLAKALDAFVVGEGLEPAELRAGLARRVVAQAVPRRFQILDGLPRDSNGKLDRAKLRSLVEPPTQAGLVSGSEAERCVLRIFEDVLGAAVSDPAADFFALGGHSLLALALGQRLSEQFGRAVPLSLVFQERTASALARALSLPTGLSERRGQDPLAPLLTLQDGAGAPLFCVHPADGLAWCYFGLVAHLPGLPMEALQAPGLTGASPASFGDLIADYLATIRARQAQGPYRLLGWSSGGGIAHALAAELVACGESVSLLALLDAYPADIWRGAPEPTEEDAIVSLLDDVEASVHRPDGSRYSKAELVGRVARPGSSLAAFDEATLQRMIDVSLQSMRMYRTAKHPVFPGDVLFFRAAHVLSTAPDPRLWLKYSSGRFEQVEIDATHLAMCAPRPLETIARTLARRLR